MVAILYSMVPQTCKASSQYSRQLYFFVNIKHLVLVMSSLIAKNDHPKINGTSGSRLKSKMTKSTGKIRVPTWTKASSRTSSLFDTEWSANFNIMVVGLGLSSPNLRNMEVCIKWILVPKSHKPLALSIYIWTVKLPGSFNLVRSLFWIQNCTPQWVSLLHTLPINSCCPPHLSHIWHT